MQLRLYIMCLAIDVFSIMQTQRNAMNLPQKKIMKPSPTNTLQPTTNRVLSVWAYQWVMVVSMSWTYIM